MVAVSPEVFFSVVLVLTTDWPVDHHFVFVFVDILVAAFASYIIYGCSQMLTRFIYFHSLIVVGERFASASTYMFVTLSP